MLYYLDGTVAGMATTKFKIKAVKGNSEVTLEFRLNVYMMFWIVDFHF